MARKTTVKNSILRKKKEGTFARKTTVENVNLAKITRDFSKENYSEKVNFVMAILRKIFLVRSSNSSKMKWLHNGWFWGRSSDQQNRWLMRMLRKLARANDVNTVTYSLELYAIHFIPTNMVRAWVRGKQLRMRKQKTRATVPLDVVPERRTKRCSPRFRPGGRFCELRFRYLSSPIGREGEISRPLDHICLLYTSPSPRDA